MKEKLWRLANDGQWTKVDFNWPAEVPTASTMYGDVDEMLEQMGYKHHEFAGYGYQAWIATPENSSSSRFLIDLMGTRLLVEDIPALMAFYRDQRMGIYLNAIWERMTEPTMCPDCEAEESDMRRDH